MTKPQPWYAAFNQPPRSAKKHGRNWKPSSQAHGNPVDRADPAVDSGADDASSIWTWHTGSVFPYPEPHCPEPIPYAGVRAGEIIGHRMWLVLDEGLCSLVHHFIWEPGATIEGKVDEIIEHNMWNFIKPIYGGVYSFDSYERLIAKEGPSIKTAVFPFPWLPDGFGVLDFSRAFMVRGLVIGTVKCWGEVIEHEEGWRAQYAKLHSINHIVGHADINALRERYKV